jgi:hypothetical protein
MKEAIEDEAIIEVYDNGEVVSGEQSITVSLSLVLPSRF